MAETTFDPARTVRFDLAHGSVHAGGDARQVLLPVEAIDAFAKAAGPAALEAVGRATGAAIGKRVAARLADGASAATVEAVATHLGGEIAVAGFGMLSFERWGRALVVVIERSPAPHALVVAMVESALEAAGGRHVACALLSHDAHDGPIRLLVSSEAAAKKVREWIDGGVAWGEALTRLHVKSGGAS